MVYPSGFGRCALLNVITDIDRPTSGDVSVTGQRLDVMSENKLVRFRGRHVGVPEIADRLRSQTSGGQHQRAAIARGPGQRSRAGRGR